MTEIGNIWRKRRSDLFFSSFSCWVRSTKMFAKFYENFPFQWEIFVVKLLGAIDVTWMVLVAFFTKKIITGDSNTTRRRRTSDIDSINFASLMSSSKVALWNIKSNLNQEQPGMTWPKSLPITYLISRLMSCWKSSIRGKTTSLMNSKYLAPLSQLLLFSIDAKTWSCLIMSK